MSKFLTYDEAKEALQSYCLSFNNILDYRNSYKDVDLRMPSHPDKIYIEWKGWADFLGIVINLLT